jgi:hypothetical protein
MPNTTMATTPHHDPTLHEVWEAVHTAAGESLVAHWIDDAPDQEDSDGRSSPKLAAGSESVNGAFGDETREQEETK